MFLSLDLTKITIKAAVLVARPPCGRSGRA